MSAAFEVLKGKFPIWTLRNKSNTATLLELAGGDSVQVGPNAFCRIDSSKLHQVPSIAQFEFVTPNLQDMVAVGLIRSNNPAPIQSRDVKVRPSNNATEE